MWARSIIHDSVLLPIPGLRGQNPRVSGEWDEGRFLVARPGEEIVARVGPEVMEARG